MVSSLDDTKNSIEITNNANLVSLGMDFEYCAFCFDNLVITNNPKLDLKKDCDAIISIYSSYRTISNNFADCGCAITADFNKFVTTLTRNCWMIIGNVTIDQNSDYKVLAEKLVNVTRISGGLSIKNTNFEDLSFLNSIEWIGLNAYKSEYLASITISNNANLTSLKTNFKRDGLYLTVRDNPKLCMTTQNLDNLFYGLSLDSDLNINICFNEKTPDYWCDLPESGYFSDLPDGCKNLTGNLLIDDHFDFKNSYKLHDVENIYGSITIQNSSIRNLNFLPNLSRIRSIKDKVAPFIAVNNSKLFELFTTMQFEGAESGVAVTVENNESLMVPDILCSFFRTRKSPIVKDNYDSCGTGEKPSKHDKYSLNVDVFHGLPVFKDVSVVETNPDNGGVHNNPWTRNTTDSEYYTDEETSTENFCIQPFTIASFALVVTFRCYLR
ncbi:Receptor L-domain domain-containing protein [Caenorhabditis elegans]|uniref:Receptor L-domain domain-containing protein n=1 Tax=Caenorhabditis elegans TaxID=6239 RepID=A0A4V0IKC4_CAEEL|nr:Receptor L-domain domain-containing protein [Caenorhabditis elegans]VTW47448.1 Receptor L-domain domain-containing protein [Caenorhabditis elegans]